MKTKTLPTFCIASPSGKHSTEDDWWCEWCSEELQRNPADEWETVPEIKDNNDDEDDGA